MALKFAVTRNDGVPRYDLASAEEGLIESIEEVTAAAEALYSVGADGAELCQVMDNLSLALEAINNGGLTAELLATFNSEGELSACCGMESLTVAGLEALGEAQVSKLEDKYVAGLEGKMAEYWNKFVMWIKNLWAKLVNWFKACLVNRARYSKAILAAIQAYDTKGSSFDEAKEAKVIKAAEGDEAVGFINAAETWVMKPIDFAADATKTAADELIKNLDKVGEYKADKAEKLSTLGWNLAKAKAMGMQCIKFARPNNGFAKASTSLNNTFDNLVKEAQKAGAIENEEAAKNAKDALGKKREGVLKALDVVRNDNRAVMKLAGSVLKVLKAGYKAK